MTTAAPTVRPNPVRRLPGMRDFDAGARQRKQDVERRLADFIGRFGYSALEVPVLESTELFLSVLVKDRDRLARVIRAIRALPSVHRVQRV